MTAREAAAATLAAVAPELRIYDAGKFPRGSAYRQGGVFFCAVDMHTGGWIYVGQGADLDAAVCRAVKIAKRDWT